ncbi:MAG TPA: cell envelope integrity protein TolA [Burkholderiales bacterium]|nr:cell envelope integrity protein TolA [Burkholderiales bacterium]
MTAYVNETPNEKALSGALALVMHVLFFALLVFGVAWQKREAPPMMAELWSELPAPKVAPPPPPRVEPKPEPKAQPKPPPPKVEPKPAPKPDLKAEIALREKKEKERKAKEQEAAEKKKREEQALAEKKKREEQAQLAKLKAQQERERAEQLAREQDEALKRIAQAEAQARLVDEYKRRIADRIRSRIVEPQGLRGNPEVEYDVVVLPGGEVFDVKLRRTSGQAAWDAAVERAIRGAQPLPLPPVETGLMREFRELNLKFRPKE